jgi:hypothetical protein
MGIMHNKQNANARFGGREQMILVLLTFVACLAVFAFGAPDKWLTAVYCTIPTFAGMISYFRKKIAPKTLWAAMSIAFLLHILLLWAIFGVVLKSRGEVGLAVCIPGIFLECFVLYHGVKLAARKLAT